jgi:hypothetical protein
MQRGFLATALGLLLVPVVSTQEFSRQGKTVELFNGKDLSGWKNKGSEEKSRWRVGRAAINEANPGQFAFTPGTDGKPAELVNTEGRGVDLYCDAKFGDCVIEVEFMIPKGSNSGVYVMGEYEVQILDSFGKTKIGPGDMGGLYGAAAPRVNACRKPGEWQKYVIDFQAPRFDGNGKKTANAKFVKITLNDEVIHENVEMKGPTPSGVTGKEAPAGPLMFQGDHGPVAFRNIRVTPR